MLLFAVVHIYIYILTHTDTYILRLVKKVILYFNPKENLSSVMQKKNNISSYFGVKCDLSVF